MNTAEKCNDLPNLGVGDHPVPRAHPRVADAIFDDKKHLGRIQLGRHIGKLWGREDKSLLCPRHSAARVHHGSRHSSPGKSSCRREAFPLRLEAGSAAQAPAAPRLGSANALSHDGGSQFARAGKRPRQATAIPRAGTATTPSMNPRKYRFIKNCLDHRAISLFRAVD